MNILENTTHIKKSNYLVSLETINLLKAKICPPNSIIFPKIGEAMRTNKRRLLTKDSCFDNNCMALLPKKIQYVYCFYLFSLIKLENFEQVTTVPYVTQAIVGEIKFPRPPLPEQEKISFILSNIDDTIQNIDQIIKQTQRLKKAMMQKLLIRGIGHTKFKKVSNFFKKEIEIPEHWDYPKFNDIIKTNPFTKVEHQTVPYIPMDAVDTENPHFNYFEEREFSKNSSLCKFQENDVLFARITPSTENGKTSIVENFERKGIVSSELTVLRPSPKIIPRYLYYYVKSYRIRQFAISQMLGTTGRQRVPDYVFKKDLNIELPPRPEQQKIISIISKVDEQIIIQRKYQEKLESLKKSLMLKLLTGQIRVKV
jgi:type I restriction enzyme S subunit